jgi:uncharacterized protein YndB with AHSA1/START domain
VITPPDDVGTLLLMRLLDAPPGRVFDAWLNREEWQAWIGPEGVRCEVPLLEPRVGGRYRVTMHLSGGQTVPVAGVFKIIDRPHILAMTWGMEDDPSRQSLLTITFKKLGQSTQLTLRQEGLGSASNRDAHGEGWHSAMNKLVAYLAALPTQVHTI